MSLKKFLKKNKRRIAEAGIELVVAGYGSDGIPEWGRQGVTISGPVDRVADFYSSVDAALVPIYHGGGIKVKAVEAMAHGIPVYGTKHVREGFHEDFWTYIGDIDDLVADSSTAVPVAPVAQVASRFSSGRFCESVEELLSEAGI
jgi:glycosyltransferase involved in cell wall biosynthesis